MMPSSLFETFLALFDRELQSIFSKSEMAPIQNSVIEKVLKQIEHLPTLPQVVTKILAMTDSAKVNAVDLSKEMDQSLRIGAWMSCTAGKRFSARK